MKRIITDQPERIAAFVGDALDVSGFANYTAIGLEENGELIAGVLFDYYNGASINMHVAAKPGRRWLTREFLHFCFWYPFEQLKVRRITGLVPASNRDARKFDEHLGFELEATLKDAAPDGDVLVYRLFRDQCRWLNLKVKYVETQSPASA